MVVNRLCDPESKLGVFRWLQTVSLPGIDAAKLSHPQLPRSMNALKESDLQYSTRPNRPSQGR